MIQGAELTVKDVIEYTSQNSYVYWLNRKVPDKILNPDEYFIAMTKTAYPDLDSESTDFAEKLAEIQNEFYFSYSEYYYRELDAFLRDAYISSNPSFELWLYVTKGVESAIYYFIEDYDYLTALSYKQQHGRFPTKAEYDAIDTSIYDVDGLMNYKDLYLLYENEYYSLDFQYHPCTYIVSDETYKLFSKRIGETHPSARTDLSDRYTIIHSANPDLTEVWLTEQFGTLTNDYYDVIVTPDDVWQKHVSTIYTDIISSIVTIAVILAILCVCMYFIMRSSLMNRIKEVGIYRAIGVSKRNLIFKFLVESLVLSAFTVFLGYIGTSIFIAACLNSSPLVSDIFFYPAWYALIDFAILLALTTVCGILPILSLVRKTPSEILAKYDI